MILLVSINSINSTCDAEYKSIRVIAVTYPSNGLEQNLKPEHVAKLLYNLRGGSSWSPRR